MNNRNRGVGARARAVATEAALRAAWVEAETVRFKRLGLTFRAISEQLTRVGRDEAPALTPIPAGVSFPPGYKISAAACHKAYLKAIRSEPALEVDGLRALGAARCEEMFLALQPALRKGDPRAVMAAVKVLDHLAKLFGCYEAQRVELKNSGGELVSFRVMQEIAAEIEAAKSNPELREAFPTDGSPALAPPAADQAAQPSDNDQIDLGDLEDLRGGPSAAEALPAITDSAPFDQPDGKEK